MATLPTYFRDFLADIRPTKNQRQQLQTGHSTLRKRLTASKDLKDIIVGDFLQGSYRRATVIRPSGGERSDADIVVVTTLNRASHKPQQALQRFAPFLEEHYPDKWRYRGRSIRIELSYVELDLVVTSAPSEEDLVALRSAAVRTLDSPEDVADWRLNAYWPPSSAREDLGATSQLRKAAMTPEWKLEPLWIPDRDAGAWVPTHPLAQIDWTFDKNKRTDGHYVNVVKAVKWWYRLHHPGEAPKGYPLEHIVGDCCPDETDSIAKAVTLALEEMRSRYSTEAALGLTPNLPDRGVDQNVLKRIDGQEFASFHSRVEAAAKQARAAYDEEDLAKSAELWRKLFGDKFPLAPEPDETQGSGGRFSERSAPSVPPPGRFA